MGVKDRVAIVTGSAMGNGKGIAEVLAEHGAKVVCLDINDEALTKTIEEFKARGFEVSGYKVDVSDKEGLQECAQKVFEKYGSIDILINNAAILRYEPFIETTKESLDLQLTVNVKGPWYASQAVLPYMVKAHYGRIITISSITGNYVCDPDNVCYGVTKAALVGLGKGIAAEFVHDGITSNVICPAWINTPMVQKMAEEENPNNPQETLDRLADGMPVKRLGTPRDIGNAALFLASEDSGFITGIELVCDGGWLVPETQDWVNPILIKERGNLL